jgi:hypothetical protein
MKALLMLLYLVHTCLAAEICIEAEDFNVISGWKIIKDFEVYFSSLPATWSGNRIKTETHIPQALATKKIVVPENGQYNPSVRYESEAGFNSLFTI